MNNEVKPNSALYQLAILGQLLSSWRKALPLFQRVHMYTIMTP